MNRICIFFLVSIIVFGCDRPSSQNGESKSDRVSKTVVPSEPLIASEKPALAAYVSDEEGTLVGGVDLSHPTSVDDIEKKLRSIDWNRSDEYPPQVILSHDTNIDDIRVKGSFSPQSNHEKLVMDLSYVDSSDVHHRLSCDSVESIDQVIELFSSYYLNDDKWREMVIWKSEGQR